MTPLMNSMSESNEPSATDDSLNVDMADQQSVNQSQSTEASISLSPPPANAEHEVPQQPTQSSRLGQIVPEVCSPDDPTVLSRVQQFQIPNITVECPSDSGESQAASKSSMSSETVDGEKPLVIMTVEDTRVSQPSICTDHLSSNETVSTTDDSDATGVFGKCMQLMKLDVLDSEKSQAPSQSSVNFEKVDEEKFVDISQVVDSPVPGPSSCTRHFSRTKSLLRDIKEIPDSDSSESAMPTNPEKRFLAGTVLNEGESPRFVGFMTIPKLQKLSVGTSLGSTSESNTQSTDQSLDSSDEQVSKDLALSVRDVTLSDSSDKIAKFEKVFETSSNFDRSPTTDTQTKPQMRSQESQTGPLATFMTTKRIMPTRIGKCSSKKVCTDASPNSEPEPSTSTGITATSMSPFDAPERKFPPKKRKLDSIDEFSEAKTAKTAEDSKASPTLLRNRSVKRSLSVEDATMAKRSKMEEDEASKKKGKSIRRRSTGTANLDLIHDKTRLTFSDEDDS